MGLCFSEKRSIIEAIVKKGYKTMKQSKSQKIETAGYWIASGILLIALIGGNLL